MLPQEAAWIEAMLAGLPNESLTPLLDIGSADREFRTVRQPWIERRVFAPLRQRNVEVLFADVKPGPGVDVVADLTTRDGLAKLKGVAARTVLCCNVLEHVHDAAAFAAGLAMLVRDGGRLVVTVPHRYPHHRDPIDTMFRPDIAALAGLFPSCTLERAAIVQAGSYRDDFAKRPLTLLFRHLFRLPFPFLGWRAWKRSVSKLQFLVRPYEIACVCLVKGGTDGPPERQAQ